MGYLIRGVYKYGGGTQNAIKIALAFAEQNSSIPAFSIAFRYCLVPAHIRRE